MGAVSSAQLSGDGVPSDRVLVGDSFAAVIDGASWSGSSCYDGAWYAEVLRAALHERLAARPDDDLKKVLEYAIEDVVQRYALEPGGSPSATLAIARWTNATMQCLVLGDATVVAALADGSCHPLRDRRLSELPLKARAYCRDILTSGVGFGHEMRRALSKLTV